MATVADHEVEQELVDAFVEAWEAKRAEVGRGIVPPGTKVRAGLAAVLSILEDRKTKEEIADTVTFDMVLGGVDYAQAPLPIERIDGQGPRARAS